MGSNKEERWGAIKKKDGEQERRKGKGKEILMVREQENILNGGRVEI